MNDGEALLRAVIDRPDDDTPRLVYADYLDDLGGEANTARARLIRIQVALERAEPDATEVSYGGVQTFRGDLEKDQEALISAYHRDWSLEPEYTFVISTAVPEYLMYYVESNSSDYHRGFLTVSVEFSDHYNLGQGLIRTDDDWILGDELRNAIAALNGFSSLRISHQQMRVLQLPKGFDSDCSLVRLRNLETVRFPEGYNRSISLEHLEELHSLELPKNYKGGSLNLNNLYNLQVLELPAGSQTNLNLREVPTLEVLRLPSGFQGNIRIYQAPRIQTLELPTGYKGNLVLTDLAELQTLILPEGYKGNLDLYRFPALQSLSLPKGYEGSISGYLLHGLQYIDFGGERLELVRDGIPRTREDITADILKLAEAGKIDGVKSFRTDFATRFAPELEEARARGIADRAAASVKDNIKSGNAAGTSLPPEPPNRWVGRSEDSLIPSNHRHARRADKRKDLLGKSDFGPAG